jgi:hypothetical protein
MPMTRACIIFVFALASLLAFACGQSDYRGGGRRTDLGRASDDAIAVANPGGDDAGTGGVSAGTSATGAGYAGCRASDGGSPLTGCTP